MTNLGVTPAGSANRSDWVRFYFLRFFRMDFDRLWAWLRLREHWSAYEEEAFQALLALAED